MEAATLVSMAKKKQHFATLIVLKEYNPHTHRHTHKTLTERKWAEHNAWFAVTVFECVCHACLRFDIFWRWWFPSWMTINVILATGTECSYTRTTDILTLRHACTHTPDHTHIHTHARNLYVPPQTKQATKTNQPNNQSMKSTTTTTTTARRRTTTKSKSFPLFSLQMQMYSLTNYLFRCNAAKSK